MKQKEKNSGSQSIDITSYVDAAYDDESEIGYYGFVVLTPDKEYGTVGKFNNNKVCDSARAEVHALRETLEKLEKIFSGQKIKINTDYLHSVEYLEENEKGCSKKDLQVVLDNVRDIADKSQNKFFFNWVPRDENEVSHKIVRQAKISDDKDEYHKSKNQNWKIARKNENVFRVFNSKEERLCTVNLEQNFSSCCPKSNTKCRHRFFLERCLGKDKTHQIVS